MNSSRAGSIGLICLILSFNVWSADDLLSLYKKALDYDATIAIARANLESVSAGESQALAALLPQLSGSASVTHTNRNIIDPVNTAFTGSNDSFEATTFGLNLDQAVLDLNAWYNLSASEQSTLAAQTEYLSAEQTLIIQVTAAYFGVLRAQEDLTTAKSQETAVKRQFEQAREQFEVGLIAITDVHEAQAQFDSSRTNRIRAEGNLTVAFEELARLTGVESGSLKRLKASYPIALDSQLSALDWVNRADTGNLSVQIASYNLASAQADLKASQSGHAPTVGLSAGYSHQELDNNRNSNGTEESSISLTLNVPFYSGGATSAAVKRSRALVKQATQQLEAERRSARVDARTQYINLQTNVETVESLAQTIVSRESALEATREGYNVGTRNIVEVLDAEREYYAALRDFATSRFDFVETSLAIKATAGNLGESDLKEINDWLE